MSLYDYLRENMRDGALPEGFSLPGSSTEGGVAFADGALDGITVYHYGGEGPGEAELSQMAEAFGSIVSGSFPEADRAFAALGRQCRAVRLIDELQAHILDRAAVLDPDRILQGALYLAARSSDRESVKFGLSITELILPPDRQTKEIIRVLGASEEFALFAVWNMRKWENGNEELFRLAQKLHGWGRIHAVEQLTADTPEIRAWLLKEGIRNEVMESYSALTVWNAAGAASLLKDKPTKEETESLCRLMTALLDEGPVPGISAVENAEEAVSDLLIAAGPYAGLPDVKEALKGLRHWAEKNKKPLIAGRCETLLNGEA